MVYKTKGVCAQGIEFEIDDNKKVHNIKFTGGCSGNTQGVARLVEGMDVNEACKSHPPGIERRLISHNLILYIGFIITLRKISAG